MRLKLSSRSSSGHKSLATCVAWNSAEEVYSCGEDHQLICWYTEGGISHSSVIAKFPDDFFPTDMEWHPRPLQTSSSTAKKQSLDVLLVTTTDGRFHFINKTGRIEKSVNAHNGATLAGKWIHDGTALLTAGEDGLIKIWSRNGMLRSTVVKGSMPVYTVAWGPTDYSTIIYSQGGHIFLQPLHSYTKSHKWLAHEGIILSLACNHNNGLIVSGGEDCKYKVWDSSGFQLLFTSGAGNHSITSISWCYSGNYFTVGSFNTVRLCDKTGWSYSLEKLTCGSIYSTAWSKDSTQVAMACGNGMVLTGHVIGKSIEWNNYQATLTRKKTVEVREICTDLKENLELSDRVILMEFGFDHLVVITPIQCHVYSVKNWNTPAIFELKNSVVSAVLLASKHFLLVERSALILYSYEGRLLGMPKWKGMNQEPIYPPCISLSCDTLAVRDQGNDKLIHIIEVASNKPSTECRPYTHPYTLTRLALNQTGDAFGTSRRLAVIDANKDLFLISLKVTHGLGQVSKLASTVQSICWAVDSNVLTAMLDTTLSVWLCPNYVHYSDYKMIRRTRIDKDNSEFGKHPTVLNVYNGIVTVRRGDGALVNSYVDIFFTKLYKNVLNTKWKEAVSLCRRAENKTLWTCMAIMATDHKELDVAEEAFAAIDRFDKVDYIQWIKKSSDKTKKSDTLLMAGDALAAEGVLLQNGLYPEAIMMNLTVYNWNRALELATRYKSNVKEVLEARKKYLASFNKKEVNQHFLLASKVTETTEEIIEREQQELMSL